jgi:predicted RNA-binding protein YlqC (UPF0109 family)
MFRPGFWPETGCRAFVTGRASQLRFPKEKLLTLRVNVRLNGGGDFAVLGKEIKMEKDLIEYIAKSLVDDPASVNVSIIEGEKSTILELRVAADDIGKVIGKHGRIAKAMRTVLQAATAKTGRHTVLEILD